MSKPHGCNQLNVDMSSYNSRRTVHDFSADKTLNEAADAQGNFNFWVLKSWLLYVDELHQENALHLPISLTEVEREYGVDAKSTVVVYSKKKESIDDKIGKFMNHVGI